MTSTQKILDYPLVPVFYHPDLEICKEVIKACYEGGVRVFEFTNRGENALQIFEELVKFAKSDCPEMLMGIGTIHNVSAALDFIKAGAEFVVQPFTSPEVGEVCKQRNIGWIPGAMTVTEIQNAVVLGAEIVKIFPANVLGSSYIKALRGPMPNVKLMATGGVEPTEESINEWFSAGINAVGLGSQLFKNISQPEKISHDLEKLFSFLKS